jgi:hypothetical protein
VFILDGSGVILQPGASRSYSSGEGVITTTLNSRTLSSAAFTTTHERYGTGSITYSWDSPPEILRTGDVVPFSIRWNVGQRYSRFSPQMGSLAHLDWSTDWYTTQCYGELCPSSSTSGQECNTAITVTSNNPTQLVFYVEVHSTPGAVRVQWTYRRVDGSAPPSPGTPGAVTTAPTSLGGAWNDAGQAASITQDGRSLVFTNRMGMRSRGTIADATTVVATEWENGLRGTLTDNGNTIRWANGTVWYRVQPGR